MNETPAKTAEGQVVWITGASSGIGRALAHEWGARGAKLILSGRDLQRLSAVADRTGCQSAVADLMTNPQRRSLCL